MTSLPRHLLAIVLAVAVFPATSRGEMPASPATEPTAPAYDCSRWPASIYNDVSASCVCPQGMWWNLRGDACLPREHAGNEFCSTVWPGSQAFFVSGGGYRCVCAPPLLWNAEATACRAPIATGDDDCEKEWPGTRPVLAPSGTESECRCPGGRRWDEASRTCVEGAPAIGVARGYLQEGYGAAPVPGGAPIQQVPPPQMPGAAYPTPPVPPTQPAMPGAVAPTPTAPGPGGASGNPACDALLAEIRMRAAAGQRDQADALGMKAAIAGCDPKAISDAARVPSGTR